MDDLGIDAASQGQWLTTAFALTMAVVIPITGFLLQRVNTRPVFIAGDVALHGRHAGRRDSRRLPLLVVGRVVQASGTAIMMPLLMTTVLTLVPPSDRGRIMGRISIVMSVAPAVGPAISGIILSVPHLAVPVLARAADRDRGARARDRAGAERQQPAQACGSTCSR